MAPIPIPFPIPIPNYGFLPSETEKINTVAEHINHEH